MLDLCFDVENGGGEWLGGEFEVERRIVRRFEVEGDVVFLIRGGGGGFFGYGFGYLGEDILFEDRLVVRLVGMVREGGNL